MTDKQWRSGERCRLTFEGRTVDATVDIVSAGRPLAVTFDALLAGCAGFMGILWIDGRPIELLSRKPVDVAEAGPEGPP